MEGYGVMRYTLKVGLERATSAGLSPSYFETLDGILTGSLDKPV